MINTVKAAASHKIKIGRKDALIREHAPLVKIIASRLAVRLPNHIDINDLISVGIEGLIKALDRFDPSKGVKMETYLSFRIRGAMLDELRNMDWVPRSVRQKVKQLEAEYLRIEAKLGRPPMDEEIAACFGMDEKEYQKFLKDAGGAAVLSLEDMGIGEDGEQKNILECIADSNSKDPIVNLNIEEIKRHLTMAVNELPEKERFVLSLYYYDELNLKEIGKVLGITESRVCQIHSQAILRLKAKLGRFKKDEL